MICPICGSCNVHVIDSRAMGNKTTHRRYTCDDCGVRFSTDEMVTAIKKGQKYERVPLNGEREREVYRRGIEEAIEAVNGTFRGLLAKK